MWRDDRVRAPFAAMGAEQKSSGGRLRYHGQDLRLGRHSESGRIYHITTVTRDRMPVFRALPAARAVIQVLAGLHDRGRAKTLAYVLMPDHLHWLMQLGDENDLSKAVAAMKSLSARNVGIGRLWQAGFYDHAVRWDEEIQTMARYIAANPLRAGLVKSIGQYPHWDAVWL